MNKDRNLRLHENGTYYYRRQVKGKPVEFSLNTDKKTEARRLRDHYNQMVREQGFITFVEEKGTPVFGDVVVEWYESKKQDVRVSTLRNYKELVNNFILKGPFVEKRITGIDFKEIEDWSRGLELAPRTANKILILMSNIFKYAARMQYTTGNPVKLVKRPKIKRTKPDVFKLAEVEAIIANAPPLYKDYITFRFFTGVRPSEANALKFGDLDLQGKRVHIQRGLVYGVEDAPKNEHSDRILNLNDRAYQALLARVRKVKVVAPDRYVFINKYRNPICNLAFNKSVWKSTLERAGVRYRPSNLTRHTYITLALDANERDIYVASSVGHADTRQISNTYQGFIRYEDDIKLGQVGKKSVNTQDDETADVLNLLKSLDIHHG